VQKSLFGISRARICIGVMRSVTLVSASPGPTRVAELAAVAAVFTVRHTPITMICMYSSDFMGKIINKYRIKAMLQLNMNNEQSKCKRSLNF